MGSLGVSKPTSKLSAPRAHTVPALTTVLVHSPHCLPCTVCATGEIVYVVVEGIPVVNGQVSPGGAGLAAGARRSVVRLWIHCRSRLS